MLETKKILHIGFADHLDLIDKRMKDGTWFHSHVMNAAKEAFGLDMDCTAVEYIKRSYNVPNIYCGSVENVPKELDKEWDVVLIPEVIEHVDNPVTFLKSVKDNLRFKELVITAPNALSFRNFVRAKSNLEQINSDHRYWFTPYTLAKILTISGFNVVEIRMMERSMPSIKKCRFSIFKTTIVIRAIKMNGSEYLQIV